MVYRYESEDGNWNSNRRYPISVDCGNITVFFFILKVSVFNPSICQEKKSLCSYGSFDGSGIWQGRKLKEAFPWCCLNIFILLVLPSLVWISLVISQGLMRSHN